MSQEIFGKIFGSEQEHLLFSAQSEPQHYMVSYGNNSFTFVSYQNNLLLNGEEGDRRFKEFGAHFNIDKKELTIGRFYVEETGKEIGKQAFWCILSWAWAAGIQKISVNAGDMGKIFWAKAGFIPEQLEIAPDNINILEKLTRACPKNHFKIVQNCLANPRQHITDLMALPTVVNIKAIGIKQLNTKKKPLMGEMVLSLCENWKGSLSLTDIHTIENAARYACPKPPSSPSIPTSPDGKTKLFNTKSPNFERT